MISWPAGKIGLLILTVSLLALFFLQYSLTNSHTQLPFEDEIIDMTDNSVSPPVKKRSQPVSSTDAEVSSRSALRLPEAYDQAEALPLVTHLKEAESYDGQLVRVVGKYVESDVRMKPIGAPRYRGHVSIMLADGTRVSLFPVWKTDARRPQTEIDAFKDQEVEVVGLFRLRAPADPQGGASPRSPSLTEIKALYHH
jgi:hypothetical protein